MDQAIKEWVKMCQPCQESQPLPPRGPMHQWETPKAPWARVHFDFADPDHGQMFLIVVISTQNGWRSS